jgi:hypothetical protein
MRWRRRSWWLWGEGPVASGDEMAQKSVILQALRIALRKPAPNMIPLSEREKVRVRDYYSAMFADDQDERGFLVDQLDGENVVGRWVCRTGEPENAVLPIDEISVKLLTIRQFIGELEIQYTSPTEFVWHSRFHIPKMKLLRERAISAFYTRKLLTRSDQITVLRNLLNHATDKGEGKYLDYLMEDIYGDRWAMHPQGMAAYRYTQLLLNSLVSSTDLEIRDGKYSVTARAVATIIGHETEDRRHRDSLAQQRRIF